MRGSPQSTSLLSLLIGVSSLGLPLELWTVSRAYLLQNVSVSPANLLTLTRSMMECSTVSLLDIPMFNSSASSFSGALELGIFDTAFPSQIHTTTARTTRRALDLLASSKTPHFQLPDYPLMSSKSY